MKATDLQRPDPRRVESVRRGEATKTITHALLEKRLSRFPVKEQNTGSNPVQSAQAELPKVGTQTVNLPLFSTGGSIPSLCTHRSDGIGAEDGNPWPKTVNAPIVYWLGSEAFNLWERVQFPLGVPSLRAENLTRKIPI